MWCVCSTHVFECVDDEGGGRGGHQGVVDVSTGTIRVRVISCVTGKGERNEEIGKRERSERGGDMRRGEERRGEEG